MAPLTPHSTSGEQTDVTARLKEMTDDLLAWYRANKRPLPWRDPLVPYHTWISEIMLQQTRIDVVTGYYERFLKQFPDIPTLAKAGEEQLLKAWEGLGYYSRVKNIAKTAGVLMEEYDGNLPGTKEELRVLPGIGDYTAAAIASITAREPVAAVDGNVLRVCARLCDDHRNVLDASTRKAWNEVLDTVIPETSPGDFNEAMMELGETVCLPGESCRCEACPVQTHCLAFERQSVGSVPVRIKKASKKSVRMTVFVLVTEDGNVVIRKRPDRGLLAGMFEFPNAEGHLSKKAAAGYLAGQGFDVVSLEPLEAHKHIFSHVKWFMRAYLVSIGGCDSEKADKPFQLVRSDELFSTYPVPGAFAHFRDAVF